MQFPYQPAPYSRGKHIGCYGLNPDIERIGYDKMGEIMAAFVQSSGNMDFFWEELAEMGFNPPTIKHISDLMQWVSDSGLLNAVASFKISGDDSLGKSALVPFIHFLLNDNIGDLIRYIREYGATDALGHFIAVYARRYPDFVNKLTATEFMVFLEYLSRA